MNTAWCYLQAETCTGWLVQQLLTKILSSIRPCSQPCSQAASSVRATTIIKQPVCMYRLQHNQGQGYKAKCIIIATAQPRWPRGCSRIGGTWTSCTALLLAAQDQCKAASTTCDWSPDTALCTTCNSYVQLNINGRAGAASSTGPQQMARQTRSTPATAINLQMQPTYGWSGPQPNSALDSNSALQQQRLSTCLKCRCTNE